MTKRRVEPFLAAFLARWRRLAASAVLQKPSSYGTEGHRFESCRARSTSPAFGISTFWAVIATEGLERVSEVAKATGATTGCGGCRPQIERLLAERHRETLRDGRAARSH